MGIAPAPSLLTRPDLAPSDYHLFSELKKPLRGHGYETLNEMKKDIYKKWILGTPAEFFQSGLKKLSGRWERCIAMNGNYIEKFDQIDDAE